MASIRQSLRAGQVIEGPWDEIARRGAELAGKRVRLTVLEEPPPAGVSLDEQERILDELAARFAHLPPLPEEAFSRESIYQDHD